MASLAFSPPMWEAFKNAGGHRVGRDATTAWSAWFNATGRHGKSVCVRTKRTPPCSLHPSHAHAPPSLMDAGMLTACVNSGTGSQQRRWRRQRRQWCDLHSRGLGTNSGRADGSPTAFPADYPGFPRIGIMPWNRARPTFAAAGNVNHSRSTYPSRSPFRTDQSTSPCIVPTSSFC